MKTQNVLILLVALLVLGGAGYVLSQQGKQKMSGEDVMMNKGETPMGIEQQENAVKDESMMDADTGVNEDMTKDTEMMKGSYEGYSPEKLARAKTGKVVLFFHASWCPTCRALDADITKKMDSVSDGVSILKLNFDTETELRKKYGVTVQHTLVQVDASGEQITKWSGGNTLASILSQLK